MLLCRGNMFTTISDVPLEQKAQGQIYIANIITNKYFMYYKTLLLFYSWIYYSSCFLYAGRPFEVMMYLSWGYIWPSFKVLTFTQTPPVVELWALNKDIFMNICSIPPLHDHVLWTVLPKSLFTSIFKQNCTCCEPLVHLMISAAPL